MLKLGMIVAFLVFIAANAGAKTLYVDQTIGSDSITWAANSEAAPWRTLGRAAWGSDDRNSPVAGEAAQAGDAVIVKAGTYSAPGTGTRFIPAFNPVNSGTAGNYITFQAEGPVYLELSSSNGSVIGAYYKHYIIWDGFVVDETNAPPHSDTGPLTTLFSSHITFRNNEVRGITVSYIDNHNAVRLEESNNILIENNKLHGIKRLDTSHNAAAIMLYAADDVVIQNNEIYNNNAGIFPKGLDNNNVTIRHNLIYNNYKGVRTSFSINGNVYQNVIRDCTAPGSGIQIAENTRNYTFANNTVDNCENGLHIGTVSGSSNNVFRNNLINNVTTGVNAGEVSSLSSITLNYNNFYTNMRGYAFNASLMSLSQWRSATGQDMNSTELNPQFVNLTGNNFRLDAGSPLRNAGPDVLDLDADGGTADLVNLGAYVTGSERVGLIQPSPSAPENLQILP